MHNKLLVDCAGHTFLGLNESNNGRTVFQGKFQEADAINKNRRKYPYKVLDDNVHKLRESIKAKSLFGECDHPNDSIVHLANVSHAVTKLWWEGNVLMGEGEILPTPSGMILKKLIESGCRIGISSRGVGNGENDREGILVIGESYKLVTFDCVADPSTYGAYQSIKKESIEEFTQEVIKENKKVNKDAFLSYFEAQINHNIENIKRNIRKGNI